MNLIETIAQEVAVIENTKAKSDLQLALMTFGAEAMRKQISVAPGSALDISIDRLVAAAAHACAIFAKMEQDAHAAADKMLGIDGIEA